MSKNEKERRLKKYEDWQNSLEGIHFRTNIYLLCSDEGHQKEDVIITRVLSKLPKNVREQVIDKVAFIVSNCSFPLQTPDQEWIIILNFSGQNDKDRETTVAHEIAHYWLGHQTQVKGTDKERAADDLSESWGFGRAYKDYGQFEY